jgi:hypothetical protein
MTLSGARSLRALPAATASTSATESTKAAALAEAVAPTAAEPIAPTIAMLSPARVLIVGRAYCVLPAASVSFCITWSRLKLAGFCRGGNALKLASQLAT